MQRKRERGIELRGDGRLCRDENERERERRPREKHVGIHAGTSEVIRNRQLASLPAGILPFHYH